MKEERKERYKGMGTEERGKGEKIIRERTVGEGRRRIGLGLPPRFYRFWLYDLWLYRLYTGAGYQFLTGEGVKVKNQVLSCNMIC